MFNLFRKKDVSAAVMPFETDIHCHIVPGVDDGSPDAAISAEIVERLGAMGVWRIIASPHVTQDTFENTPEVLDHALAELHAEIEKRGIEVEVSRSCEYRLDEFFQSQLKAGNITPYPGNYLLVENSFFSEVWNLEAVLFDLKVKGYKPVLAHPERYMYYDRARYDKLHGVGTLFQVNMLSLAGFYGPAQKKNALYLLEKGYVDFLGTDIHNHRHVDAIDAYLKSRDYAKIASHLTIGNDSLIR